MVGVWVVGLVVLVAWLEWLLFVGWLDSFGFEVVPLLVGQDLQKLDPSQLSPEQLADLVGKLSNIVDQTEQQLSNIKIETVNE